MSIRIWEDIVSQKKQVEDQREKILNAFKQRKVADELGAVRAEKLFRPITKLLEGKKGEEKPVPDYDIDDQTRNFKNELPFGEGDYEVDLDPEEYPYGGLKPFKEDQSGSEKIKDYEGFMNWLSKEGYESDEIIPLPEKSSPDPEEIEPIPDPEEFADSYELGEEVLPGAKADTAPPSYSAATAKDDPPKYKAPRDDDSNTLTTLNKFIKNNKGRSDATLKTGKSPFLGYTVAKAEEKVLEIYTKRAKKVLEKGGG